MAEVDALGEWAPSAKEPVSGGWKAGTPIVVDFGSWRTRVGLVGDENPRHVLMPRAAKFRDRKAGHTNVVVGNDILLDAAARQQAKPVYDGPVAVNWDSAELVFDYSFDLIGVSSSGSVESPLVIGETFLNPQLARRTLAELAYEAYGVPSLALGSGPVHSHRPHTGLVVSSGHEATHIVPWLDSAPQWQNIKRINFGGRHAVDLLQQLLVLKYPTFPTRVTTAQVEQLFQRHAFVAADYGALIRRAMDLDVLTGLERRIQGPVITPSAPVRDDEEVARRRAESTARLREQAAAARERRRREQDAEIAAFKAAVDDVIASDDPEEAATELGWMSVNELRRAYRKAENAIRKSRGLEIVDEAPDTSLLGIPDSELDADQQREKKRQHLLKASYDARQRQKQEKAAAREATAAAEAEERMWRERDLSGWAQKKKDRIAALRARLKEKERLRNDPAARRSLQLRSFLAAESRLQGSGQDSKSRRKRPTAESGERVESLAELEALEAAALDGEEEDEDDEEAQIDELQAQLLEHDPEYTLAEASNRPDWRTSTVHKFLWGVHDLDLSSQEQLNQLNLNVERVRIPEVLFQPAIGGLDQAGVGEVCSDIVTKFNSAEVGQRMAANVWLTGGLAYLPGYVDRLRNELVANLPTGVSVNVQRTQTPDLDTWRGLSSWAQTNPFVSRKDYNEYGIDRLLYFPSQS